MIGRIALAALLLLATANCAQRETASLATASAFPEGETRRLLEDGFEFIAGRYVDPVPIERVATAGLTRVGEMVQGVAIRRTDAGVQVVNKDQIVGTLPAPEARDYFGWAEVSARAMRLAWEASPTLRARDPDELITALFQGGLTRLDSYSLYLSPRYADEDKAAREGFGGIGVRLKTEETATFIETVTPDGPAMQAGLRDGDQIMAIDGAPVAGMAKGDVPKRLRGEEGSPVLLDILRPATQERIQRRITRRFVVAQSVFANLDGDIAILKVETFNAATFDEMTHYLDKLRRGKRVAGIVLDLRNNPGGHLDQAAAIADYFVESGALLTQRGRHPSSYRRHEATGKDFTNGLPMAILVNGRSASASEILAAALQDLGRAVVVGSTTFGKGSVQILHELPNRAQLRVTWARMYAPSGYVLDRLGVLPNLCSSNTSQSNPLDSRQGEHDDLTTAFVQWHRYKNVDPMVARTLRQYCPPADVTPATDMALAERVLHDRGLYRSALRTGTGSNLARVER